MIWIFSFVSFRDESHDLFFFARILLSNRLQDGKRAKPHSSNQTNLLNMKINAKRIIYACEVKAPQY